MKINIRIIVGVLVFMAVFARVSQNPVFADADAVQSRLKMELDSLIWKNSFSDIERIRIQEITDSLGLVSLQMTKVEYANKTDSLKRIIFQEREKLSRDIERMGHQGDIIHLLQLVLLVLSPLSILMLVLFLRARYKNRRIMRDTEGSKEVDADNSLEELYLLKSEMMAFKNEISLYANHIAQLQKEKDDIHIQLQRKSEELGVIMANEQQANEALKLAESKLDEMNKQFSEIELSLREEKTRYEKLIEGIRSLL